MVQACRAWLGGSLLAVLLVGCDGSNFGPVPTGTPTSTPTPTPAPAACSVGEVGPVVITTGGVCGGVETVAGQGNVNLYLGIPFAESTAGANRWQPPVPKAPWQGNIRALQYGDICPQTATVSGLPPTSEDCLSVNVWSPVGASGRPVMVFIYGGAFVDGASAIPIYDGAYLAALHDTVVVTLNYRLGALGFLAGIGGLTGNYGILDQQLALRWVQDNIAAFGGDPAKVTIFGESSGAMSVGLHMLSAPASRGLFTAGMMESNPLGLPYKSMEQATAIGQAFLNLLKCSDVDCLRAVPADTIVAMQEDSSLAFFLFVFGLDSLLIWAPVVDGTVIATQPVAAAMDGGLDRPALLGTNRDEGVLFIYGSSQFEGLTKQNYEILMCDVFGDTDGCEVIQEYPATDQTAQATLSQMVNDYLFFCANQFVARLATPSPYAYQFTHVSSFNIWPQVPLCATSVCHGAELPFVFRTLSFFMPTMGEITLSDQMAAYWGNFGQPGHDPNAGRTVPLQWPPFTPQDETYLILDIPPHTTESSSLPHKCDFWDGIGYIVNPHQLDRPPGRGPGGKCPSACS